ncbi:bis(5'-nucleosyl)-tetraphosphatase (symmetrical) YqeK [Oceanobacillus halotolerans]|uniref:bis(5'-nucleosyl)-tetraphosphatase (symmetrical) YqeK n=1 Tax=Oceanobacillus halotolerans TaxID=2663380 RepID=UPI0013DCBC0B|nr:bis(5'-nucleosyl)-tetraphosphatase (symmetrical) YqeK [Oceanobacillus halotolerans]
MNKEKAISIVKPQLTEERFEHTLRVTQTALELAETYNVNKEKVELAGILHDYAKYRPKEELKRSILTSNLPKDLLDYHHELWHGPAGALLLEQEHGINDSDVQQAIRYHTTGKANMSMLEMIIFIADYSEPGRDFPGVQEVRDIVHHDLYRASWLATRNTINFLMQKNATIYPDTFHAYNDLTRQLNGGND